MQALIQTFRIIVAGLMYAVITLALTVMVWTMLGALLISLAQLAGMSQSMATQLSPLLLPVIGLLVGRFAIQDFRRRMEQ
ncbi:MAG: hypothetical protein R3C18_23220 [Planctomycetaceae bacterium]